MSMVDRLKSYMEHIGMASTQFADEANIPRPTISQILNGRNRKISNEVIEKLHVGFPSLNMMWLLFGDGEMETAPKIKTSEPQNAPVSSVGVPQPSADQPFADPRLFAAAPQVGLQTSNINQFVNDTLRQRYANTAASVPYIGQAASGPMNPTPEGMPGTYGGVPGPMPQGSPGAGGAQGGGTAGAPSGIDPMMPAKSGDKRISYILVFYNDSTFEVLAPTTTPMQ